MKTSKNSLRKIVAKCHSLNLLRYYPEGVLEKHTITPFNIKCIRYFAGEKWRRASILRTLYTTNFECTHYQLVVHSPSVCNMESVVECDKIALRIHKCVRSYSGSLPSIHHNKILLIVNSVNASHLAVESCFSGERHIQRRYVFGSDGKCNIFKCLSSHEEAFRLTQIAARQIFKKHLTKEVADLNRLNKFRSTTWSTSSNTQIPHATSSTAGCLQKWVHVRST